MKAGEGHSVRPGRDAQRPGAGPSMQMQRRHRCPCRMPIHAAGRLADLQHPRQRLEQPRQRLEQLAGRPLRAVGAPPLGAHELGSAPTAAARAGGRPWSPPPRRLAPRPPSRLAARDDAVPQGAPRAPLPARVQPRRHPQRRALQHLPRGVWAADGLPIAKRARRRWRGEAPAALLPRSVASSAVDLAVLTCYRI